MVILGAIVFTLALRKGPDTDSAPSAATPPARGAMPKKAG
jgi:hypothetical protein